MHQDLLEGGEAGPHEVARCAGGNFAWFILADVCDGGTHDRSHRGAALIPARVSCAGRSESIGF